MAIGDETDEHEAHLAAGSPLSNWRAIMRKLDGAWFWHFWGWSPRFGLVFPSAGCPVLLTRSDVPFPWAAFTRREGFEI